MTKQVIAEIIKSFGLPYAYDHFEEETSLPYVAFYYANSNDFVADGINYLSISQLVIEFYSDNKDFTNESKIEAILKENGFVFTKSEDYIDSEKMYMVTYTTEVNLNG